jgi:hypothetical protein
MKSVACNKFHSNIFFLIKTQKLPWFCLHHVIRQEEMFCSSGGGHVDEKGENYIGYITPTLNLSHIAKELNADKETFRPSYRMS